MKNMIMLPVIICAALLMIGCGGIQQKTHSHSSGIPFVETQGQQIPSGLGELMLQASIKTHPAGFYPLESGDSHHGSDHYPFLLSIGGQVATWTVKGVQDDTPKYAPDGSTLNDSEAGPGMRYSLDKRLILKPGVYDIRIELKDDRVDASVRITVMEGKSVSVIFKPVYKMKDIPVRSPSYRKGISRLEVFVDGKKQ